MTRAVALAAAVGGLAVAFAGCGGAHRTPAKVPGTTLTVYSSLPMHGASSTQSQAIVNGARLALADAGGMVGVYRIHYLALDNTKPSNALPSSSSVRAVANRAARDRTTIGYLGDDNSDSTKASLPILARADIAQVIPSSTDVGLTRDRRGAAHGEPGKFRPGGRQTYARIVPNDLVQAGALAQLAKRDGCAAIAIWSTGSTYSNGLAANLAIAAERVGLRVDGSHAIDPSASNYRRLARGITADCFVFTGEIEENAVAAIKDAGQAHPRMRLYAGNGMAVDDIADAHRGLPRELAARFKTVAAPGNPAELPAAGRRFIARYVHAYGASAADPYAIYGYEAMSLLLDSLRRAGARANDRAAVTEALLATRNRASVLGTYSIDRNGDTTRTSFGVLTIAGGRLRQDRDVVASASLRGGFPPR
ncbi:MAG: branched-chain amino acid transport system substrate-binding protein [Solirubrobacteraceae bacterium]|nr:branched-chain amino acid transport system substrate-binding protein [Solirubrobacteraceae bacterium]